jgi:decaprenyl-phosphate phosphoribosyltransferase
MAMNNYIKIARPDHWIKNVFILPGFVFACLLTSQRLSLEIIEQLLIGFVATCLIASANYVINEWLDADFDKHHPTKSLRPAVAGGMNAGIVTAEYIALAIGGIGCSLFVSPYFLIAEFVLLFMGIVYNVRPFRSKDIPFFDVISESFNNVIRLFLGWFIVTRDWLPPVSIIIGYWMGGAFLMAVKRYAEFRMIDNHELAGLYRKSFKGYSEKSLLISAIFYALTSVFFCGIFLIKYRLELLLAMPFLCGLFCLYLYISFENDSVVQKPEKLHEQRLLMIYSVVFALIVLALMFINIPWLEGLLDKTLIKTP